MSTIASEKEDFATCPYNPSHKIAKFKLLPHVHRCKDGLKSTKKLYHCKKDSLIMFFADKKEEHIKECEFCFNIYNNLNTVNDSSFVSKKKPNYLDEQRSISLLTGTDETNTITLNLDEMSELNASILSTPSLFGNFENFKINNNINNNYKNNNNNIIFGNKQISEQANTVKFQFYSGKNDGIVDGNNDYNNQQQLKRNNNFNRDYNDNNDFSKISGDFVYEKGSDFNLQRAEGDDLDETKLSRKI